MLNLEQANQPTSTLRLEHIALSLGELYISHYRWLVKFLNKKLSCPHSAADIAQDTFVKLLGKSEPLVAISEPRAYLTTIAHGLMVSHIRRRDIERAYFEEIAHLSAEVTPTLEEQAIALEMLIKIDTMLDGLPLKVRRAFIYSQLDGLTHAQIAKTLGVSVASVRQYLAKAITHCIAIRQD